LKDLDQVPGLKVLTGALARAAGFEFAVDLGEGILVDGRGGGGLGGLGLVAGRRLRRMTERRRG